jgi:hypothetical protein
MVRDEAELGSCSIPLTENTLHDTLVATVIVFEQMTCKSRCTNPLLKYFIASVSSDLDLLGLVLPQ